MTSLGFDYWQKQTSDKPLFPDIEWSKPEQKTRAGKLVIIGGNSHGFAAVATAYSEAVELGAGQSRVILPDALKKVVPTSVLDAVYVPTNASGGITAASQAIVNASLAWADHALLIGDAGRNSETAIVYESILKSSTPLTITRDAMDLLKAASQTMVNRDQTTLIVSFAQLQKLFQAVYYPKILSFSMQLTLLVEALHKFTITYPCTIVTYHQTQLVIAHGGEIVTMEFDQPMMIWRGTVATRAACYQLWTPSVPLKAISASFTA